VLRSGSTYLGSNMLAATSGVFSPAALTCAVLEMDADAVMFSAGYPWRSWAFGRPGRPRRPDEGPEPRPEPGCLGSAAPEPRPSPFPVGGSPAPNYSASTPGPAALAHTWLREID
jgi:hypothetical protein